MLLENKKPHFDQPVLQDRGRVKVLNYLKQKFREFSKVLDGCFEVDNLPNFRISPRLLVKEDISGEILFEIEVLCDHAYMNRQFVECFKKKVESVIVSLPKD